MASTPPLQLLPHLSTTIRSRSPSPPKSPTSPSSVSSRRSKSPLSIDLTSLPPLSHPAPPSNTLLITQLDDPLIFHPASLATIRQHITHTLSIPLHSFAPLKSLRRIICSFYDIESAIKVRQHLDGAAILGAARARCYFGEPTPIGEEKKYLDRPDAGRLFFISPPPSPPVGWEMRNEDPPNKEVHAEDLADALAKLSGKMGSGEGMDMDVDAEASPKSATVQQFTQEQLLELQQQKSVSALAAKQQQQQQLGPVNTDLISSGLGSGTLSGSRSRSSTTVIYDPETHGSSPGLPAVMVVDTTMDFDEDGDGDVKLDTEAPKIIAHTSRPPVELMDQS